ncbi:MAG TPA: hypothetical protein VFO78_09085 [Candidatus Limnocylindrales bacterium]|nr:hypothetical protein [Candidatus Limnocylindrales bacterium]
MSFQQLLIVAIGAMALLALSRVARVHYGRSPHLQFRGSRLVVIGLLFVPPIVLQALTQSASGAPRVGWVEWLPQYAGLLIGVAIAMGIIALGVRFLAPVRTRPLLLLALVGSEADPYEVPFDPPVTATLARSVALVERANDVFPRGVEFPKQIDRAGFRGYWDALEDATRALEQGITHDHRLGIAVASGARATAADARSRLDTLQRLSTEQGRAWAS